jgi:hypothetical protein
MELGMVWYDCEEGLWTILEGVDGGSVIVRKLYEVLRLRYVLDRQEHRRHILE